MHKQLQVIITVLSLINLVICAAMFARACWPAMAILLLATPLAEA
jgi:hypothetical protein